MRTKHIGLIRKPQVEAKVINIIRSFKKQGHSIVTASEISVCCNMDARRTSSYLRMHPELLEYNKKTGGWIIL